MTKSDVKTALVRVKEMEEQLAVDIMQMETYVIGDKSTPAWDSLQATLDQDTGAYLDAVQRAIALIEIVTDCQKQRLLVLRYLQHKRWGEVADSMRHTEQHINRMHTAALQEIADKTQ